MKNYKNMSPYLRESLNYWVYKITVFNMDLDADENLFWGEFKKS